MSYTCYLGGALWPTPEKLQVKIKGKNKTLVLLNEGEVNFLRAPGLTEITVPFDLPMLTGSQSPDYFLGLLESLKTNKETTQFMLVRVSPSGGMLFDTNIKVSVEDYNITEDGKKGLDVAVDVNLKQWRDYGTKTVTVEEPKAESTTPTVTVQKEREASTAPTAKTYTVKAGDCLWAIAAKYYGNGADYEINRGLCVQQTSGYEFIEVYCPEVAERRYREFLKEKGRDLKIGKDHALARRLEELVMVHGFAPGAALAEIRNNGEVYDTVICENTLYNYIYRGDVFLQLTPDHLHNKGRRHYAANSKRQAARSSHGKSIETRPQEVKGRGSFGHWEMDSIMGCKGSKKALLSSPSAGPAWAL